MKTLEEILGNPKDFLEKVFVNLENDKINVSNYELDHICYRVETLEKYEFFKKELLKIGKLLLENEIGGRKIAKIKLLKPIVFRERKIYLIELPQPKIINEFKNCFEHVEFVIDDFDNFFKKYNYLDFDKNGLNKKINADIVRKYDDFVVKFHLQTLEYVVTFLEK